MECNTLLLRLRQGMQADETALGRDVLCDRRDPEPCSEGRHSSLATSWRGGGMVGMLHHRRANNEQETAEFVGVTEPGYGVTCIVQDRTRTSSRPSDSDHLFDQSAAAETVDKDCQVSAQVHLC